MTACLLQGIPVEVAEHARELARRERCSINAALLAMLAHAVSCSGTSAADVADAAAESDADATRDAVPAGAATAEPGTTAGTGPDPSTAHGACSDVVVASPSEPAPLRARDGASAANEAPDTLASTQPAGRDVLSGDVATPEVDMASARGWAMAEDSSLEAAEALALREALMAARMVPSG